MMYRVFKQVDGTLRIVRPNNRLRRADETDGEFINRIGGAAVGSDPSLVGLPYADIDEADFPQDRAHRDRWRLEGKKIVVLAEK